MAAEEGLNTPAVSRAIPFLPGMSYSNPARARHAKSHIFEFKVGVGRNLTAMATEVDPLERVVTTGSLSRRGTGAGGAFSTDPAQQEKFVPSYVGLDGKVLRFLAVMSDSVPESMHEGLRNRSFAILYYLVDDSMQIIEQRQENSGYVQGVFMKRHRVPRTVSVSAGDDGDFVSLHDFAETQELVIYGRVFRITGCNEFTAEFYKSNGIPLSGVGGSHPSTGVGAPDFDTARLKPNQRAGHKRAKFLKYNNKVLRFYALWDDRKSMFGDKRHYVVNFYLADDALEVLERYGANEGRDPYPKLVKKSKIPKKFVGLNVLGVSEDDVSDSVYIRDADLVVGNYVEIYGRKLYLYDCDSFTRSYYESVYNSSQPDACPPPEELIEYPQQIEPPYTGYGTEEDSIASFYRLVPKAPSFDALKQEELDKIIFRWKAKFDMDKMGHAGPDDSKRRFVVSFFMSDSTVAVYEPPVSNSGFIGGKFLERQKVRRQGSGRHESLYLTEHDMLVDLPATVWINGYPMMLLECDRFTLRYRNKGNIASLLSLDTVHEKIRAAVGDSVEGLHQALKDIDYKQNGEVYLDNFVQLLDRYDTQLDEDELLALVQHWDADRSGVIKYGPFVAALG
eukprot:CAMPEP_0206237264 /NCGR_PEP_ID=MMETSP0047_2-20121206/14173_1 /ASSEMBLY_ACC=CAM_ASM_000192 /TAXON_ID=195065 /ORGANISM="Chroomonas mesostigmatica_cf, Strain CCMP1168" /LENGTH=619 /DNA_ID=CAMNT_0053661689 /DNA_START=87 /DNA_END=1946 /DNA_ORIENTATION=-